MKILFVGSCKENSTVSSIILNQGDSLKDIGEVVDYFVIIGKGFFSYIKSILILKKYFKKNDYDIIHAHYGLTGIVTLLAKKKQKLVVSFMGDDIVGTNKLNGSVTILSKIFSKINIFLAKNFYDHSIVKSNEMYEILGLQKKASIVANGVNLEKFYPIDLETARLKTNFDLQRKYVLFVAKTSRVEKNYPLAEKTFTHLNNINIKLTVVSGVSNIELLYYYNSADCLLLTSYHEGSPNVIKEAMACNCPIVSTNVGDVKDLFGVSDGHYIASFDSHEIAQKIQQALLFRFTKNYTSGRKRIIELGLDSYTVALKLRDIYKSTIN